jgi:hypothetical protein
VVAGVIAWLLARRRWRSAGVAVLLSGIVVGGWFAYTALAGPVSDTGSSYGRDLSQVASTGPGGVAGLFMQGTKNARLYLMALPEAIGVPTLPGTPIDNLLWLIVLIACGSVGLVALLRRCTSSFPRRCCWCGRGPSCAC